MKKVKLREIIYLFRSVVFYVGYSTGLFVYILLILPVCTLVNDRKRYFLLSRVNLFVIWWARIACGIRYKIEGIENIPQQPCIVVSNHQSSWETYLLGLLFFPQTTVLKRELTHIPVFGRALQMANPIAIDRSKPSAALKQLLKQGKKSLTAGIWVMIYPEGTRVRPGHKGRFNKGAAMLAGSAGVPLLPVVHNAGSFWPAGQLKKRPGLVKVVIGEPITTANKSRDEIHKEMVKWIRQTSASLREKSMD